MPTDGRYRIGPRPQPVVPNVAVRNTPHTAKGYASHIQPLTPRERAARHIQRMTRTADSVGFATDAISGRNTVLSGTNSFFSPQLSTDFLELPQSLREKREIYR